MNAVASFVVGIVFACGLGLSGMTDPNKVLAFLDVTGAWDPSLLFVMAGAVGTHALFSRIILQRPSPLLDTRWHLPGKNDVDRRLLAGSIVFGIGWGLAGFCPGPALATLGYGKSGVVIFVGAMIAGAGLFRFAVERGRQLDRIKD